MIELPNGNQSTPQPPQLIVTFDPAAMAFGWRFTGPIPHGLIVNACEVVKAAMVQAQLMHMQAIAQQQMAQRVTMPDGSLPPG